MRTVILYILLFTLPFQLRADFCIPSLESDLNKVIFIGKVLSKDETSLFVEYGPLVITNFQVIRSFNGFDTTTCWNCDYNMNYISVLNSVSASSIDFKVDSIYLVFANRYSSGHRILWTNDCTHTKILSSTDTTIKVKGDSIVSSTEDSILKTVLDKYGVGFKHLPMNKGFLHWKMEQDSLVNTEELSLANQVDELKKINSGLTTKFYTIIVISAIFTIGFLFYIMRIQIRKSNNTE